MGAVGKLSIFIIFLLFLPILGEEAFPTEKVIHWEVPSNQRWMSNTRGHRANLQLLFDHLRRSPTGRGILAQARKKARVMGKQLHQLVLPGEVSLTNTTLLRRFKHAHSLEFSIQYAF